jgi:hypothetical protein
MQRAKITLVTVFVIIWVNFFFIPSGIARRIKFLQLINNYGFENFSDDAEGKLDNPLLFIPQMSVDIDDNNTHGFDIYGLFRDLSQEIPEIDELLKDNLAIGHYLTKRPHRLRDQAYIEALRRFLSAFTAKHVIALKGFEEIEPILEGRREYKSLSPEQRAREALKSYREKIIEKMRADEIFKEAFDGDEDALDKFLQSLTEDELALLEHAVYTSYPIPVCKTEEEKRSLIRVVRKIKERSGNNGLYEYLSQTEYYRAFKQRLKEMGVEEEFDRPGEHFSFTLTIQERVYRRRQDKHDNLEEYYPSVSLGDTKSLLIDFLEELKAVKEEDGEDLYQLKRAIIEVFRTRGWGETEEEILTTIEHMGPEEIRERLKEVIKALMAIKNPNQNNNADQLAMAVLILAEICDADGEVILGTLPDGKEQKISIADLKDKILRGDLLETIRAITDYWTHMKRFLRGLIEGESDRTIKGRMDKFYQRYLGGLINDRINPNIELEEELKEKQSRFSVELSDRKFTDMYKGFVSDDCEKNLHFYDTLGFLVDPAILIFRIMEENGRGRRWVGHIVAVVAKDRETGEPVLVIDIVQLGEHHWLCDSKSSKGRAKFVEALLDGLADYARRNGFRRIVFSRNEGTREGRTYISNRREIALAIERALKERGAKVVTREEGMDETVEMQGTEESGGIQWELIPVGTAGERYEKLTASGMVRPLDLEYRARRFVGLPVGDPRHAEVEKDPATIGHLLDFGFPLYYNTALQIFDLDTRYLPPEP